MSSEAYQKLYDNMTDYQKDVVWDLWMKAVNHDGHAWVTFGQFEEAVVKLLSERKDDKNI